MNGTDKISSLANVFLIQYDKVFHKRYENAVQPENADLLKLQIYLQYFLLSTKQLVCVTGCQRLIIPRKIN